MAHFFKIIFILGFFLFSCTHFQIPSQPLPDLTVRIKGIVKSQVIFIFINIQNIGYRDSKPCMVRVRVWNKKKKKEILYPHMKILRPSQKSQFVIGLRIPKYKTLQVFTLEAKVDFLNTLKELDEFNNKHQVRVVVGRNLSTYGSPL